MHCLSGISRLQLASFPTPLHQTKNLSSELGGPTLFLKRDDETGLGLGGNKVRKLEFILPEAVAAHSDLLITFGGVGSNHARLTAAAARRIGMDILLVLCGKRAQLSAGNALLDRALGAEIRLIAEPTYEYMSRSASIPGMVEGILNAIAAEKMAEGRKPFVVPGAGCSPLGVLGYVEAAREMVEQASDLASPIDYVLVSVGSGGTYAGLVLGMKLISPNTRVIGIDVARLRTKEGMINHVISMANEAANLLGIETRVEQADLEIHDFAGEGYTIPSSEGYSAISQMARLEGILLDPIYTGKGMAGTLKLIGEGRLHSPDSVVFVHTGGAPGLLADTDFLSQGEASGFTVMDG